MLLADNADFLARFGGPDAWPVILMGAGVIVLLEVIIRLLVPSYRRPVIGSLIFGFVLLAIGLQGVIGWEFIWSFALIAIGLAILVGGLAWCR